jgi:hypothetical protein
MRALDVIVDATGDADGVEVSVELCPEGRVYGVDISATAGATLFLQDSEMSVGLIDDRIHFDLPGLRWPAFARFFAAAGSVARLRIIYGNCKP